jgi:hypothetical protein
LRWSVVLGKSFFSAPGSTGMDIGVASRRVCTKLEKHESFISSGAGLNWLTIPALIDDVWSGRTLIWFSNCLISSEKK